MENAKIIIPSARRKPCLCGATLSIRPVLSRGRWKQMWLCSQPCGARGFTYAGALRRKLRLDLLSWGDLRRNAQALIVADSDEPRLGLLQ
jgi:hypothetical protein